MAKNIFEELIEETEKILGGSFRIEAKTEGCDFCLKDFGKEKIRKAFQKTVKFVMKNTRLKNFCFREEEIGKPASLASAFLKLVCSGMNFLSHDGQYDDQRHVLECVGCQITFFKTAEYFTAQLISEKESGWPATVKRIFKKIFKKFFDFRRKTADCKEIDAAATSLISLLCLGAFINSKEKWETVKKYFPLFGEREIKTEEVIVALTKATDDKRNDLNPEEFENVLKKLVQ